MILFVEIQFLDGLIKLIIQCVEYYIIKDQFGKGKLNIFYLSRVGLLVIDWY